MQQTFCTIDPVSWTTKPVRMVRVLRWILFVIFCLPIKAARAWGQDGHRIIAHIAWLELSDEEREKLQLWLDGGGHRSLARMALWSDEIKPVNDNRWEERWHYVNVDRAALSYDATRDCPGGDCAPEMIAWHLRMLSDPNSSEGIQLMALRWLTHLIGDIHQPLHVFHQDMRGGTHTHVRYQWRRQEMHTVWDVSMIRSILRAQHWDWLDYAKHLHGALKKGQRDTWLRAPIVLAWTQESLDAAREFAAVSEGAKIGDEYLERCRPVVEARMQAAGLRLAFVLRTWLKQQAPARNDE